MAAILCRGTPSAPADCPWQEYCVPLMGHTDRFNVCPHLGVLKANAGNFFQISAGLRDGGWGCLLEVVSDCGLEGL